MNDAQARAFLRHLYDVAVARAHPAQVLPAHLPSPPAPGRGRTVVIGAGKASGAMARALDAAWPADHPLSGVVITRHGHTPPLSGGDPSRPPRLRILEAGHPVPDEAGLQATQAMLACLQGLTPDDLVIALMSGGGSALLTAPCEGGTLQDEQALSRQLLRSGAPIGEMNTVRRHLSAIKGGRLALACAPARLVTLAISDVPGDQLADIASGPTVADSTTCADALQVVQRHGLSLPPAWQQGLACGRLETIKPGDPRLAGHEARLIATPHDMLEAAAQAGRAAGWRVHILSDRLEGESREMGRLHAALAAYSQAHAQPFQPPCVILSGGETTVTLSGPSTGGSGGRSSELLLAAALALHGHRGVWMLAADTDGIDGVGEAAGACIGPDTLSRAAQLGLDAARMLHAHDSGDFFARLGDALVTGPTFTNVNDFRAVLLT
ncbi:MAG: glycerate kinase [Aquabacterium sp.]